MAEERRNKAGRSRARSAGLRSAALTLVAILTVALATGWAPSVGLAEGTVPAAPSPQASTAPPAGEPVYPARPEGSVRDLAGVFAPSRQADLEGLLADLERATTAELAVVTVKTTQPVTVEEYAVKLFEKWGIGKKGRDNGVLMLLAIDDRAIKIEVGYGLEPAITDGTAGSILDRYVIPRFKDNDYAGGLVDGAKAIANLIARDAQSQLSPQYQMKGRIVGGLLPSFIQRDVIVLLVLGVIGIIVIIAGLGGFITRRCPKCGGRMFRVDRVAVHATAHEAGRGQRVYRCRKCGYEVERDFVIPPLGDPRGGSGGSGGTGGMGPGWFGGLGGFGGGKRGGGGFGGFGGGRSGGGGASRKW